MVGAERFELPTLWSQTRYATRLRYAPTKRNIEKKCFRKEDTSLAALFNKSGGAINKYYKQKSTMKTTSLKKTFLTILLLTIASQASAWTGYDYDNKSEIDIGDGNLVREGLMIQFYDNKDDNFHTAKVTFVGSIAGGTEIQVEDLDLNKERTFIMNRE
jgi:hypothetical protein